MVQPWYVRDSDRRSTPVEEDRMRRIRSTLIERYPAAQERLLPTNVVELKDIPRYPEIAEQFYQLQRDYRIGSQYEWLARLAKWKGVRLELSVLHGAGAKEAFRRHLAKDKDDSFVLQAPPESPLNLYNHFAFPLYGLSKPEMSRQAAAQGFDDIMELTWFCFNPILGTPCANCNPCKQAVEEGMGYRVPTNTPARKSVAWLQMLPVRTKAKIRRMSGA